MFVTLVTCHKDRTTVHQIEAATLKDCLVVWAGKVEVEGMTDASRTRLRGDMADFDAPPIAGFGHVWRLTTDLGLDGDQATVVAVETVRT